MDYYKLFLIIFLIFLVVYYFFDKNNLETFNCKIVNDLPIDFRVKYYMKDAYHDKIYIPNNIYSNNNFVVNTDSKFKIGFKIFKSSFNTLETIEKRYKQYIVDMAYVLSFTNKNDNYFQIGVGDIASKSIYKGVIGKSRLADEKNIILLKLNYPRHWKGIKNIKNYDIPFNEKNNKIIWRGDTTGYPDKSFNKRYILVVKYFNHKNKNIDVGFSNVLENNDIISSRKYLKNKLKKCEQLQSKFIISIEGNDVASGLKWQLYSNSVVFMAKPKICSWLMEDMLVPGVHYILLKDDYSDLEEKYNWALNHEEECINISKNSTDYMEQFLDKNKEDKISKLIIDKYFENVSFAN